MTTIANLCAWCTRFHRDRRDITAYEAFPEGIPKAIRLMDHDHRRPYPGDHGLRFAGATGSADFLPPEVSR